MDQFNSDFNGVQPKKIVSIAGLALFFMTIISVGSGWIIDALVSRFNPALARTDWYLWAVNALALIVISFPVYYLIIRRIPNSARGETVKLKPSRFFMIFFICVAAMYISNFLGSLLTIGIALSKGEKELFNPAINAFMNSNYIISFTYAALVAPVFEELIFRKILLDKLRRFGDLPAILMTGIAFGLFHMNLSQFFYAAVLGFIFAYVTIRTNTVKYSILLHMMVNSIGAAATPFVSDKNITAIIIIGMIVVACITLGLVFFILNFRKIRIERSLPVMKLSDYFLNTGTILYVMTCFALIILVTVKY